MRIESNDNFIEIEVQLETDKSLPSYGDGLLSIRANSNGYSGKNQTWVSKQELNQFAESIIKIETERRGEATIRSISPKELYLRIYSYDSLGHFAVEGHTGYRVIQELDVFHSVKFGFTIEPQELLKLCDEDWVKDR